MKFNLRPVFVLNPDKFDLGLNDSIGVCLEALSFDSGIVEQEFYCHATIQGEKDKNVIMSTHITAKFVDPSVLLSKKTVCFRIDISSCGVTHSQLQGMK